MKAAWILRGISSLAVVACSVYLLLNGLLLGLFVSSSYNTSSRFLVHVPGAPESTDFSSDHPALLVICFILIAGGGGLLVWGLRQLQLIFASMNQEATDELKSVEDRLDELERLKRRDMVTAEEYTAKRLDILKNL